MRLSRPSPIQRTGRIMLCQRHKRVAFLEAIYPGFDQCPCEQTRRREDEDHDDSLVLEGVSFCTARNVSKGPASKSNGGHTEAGGKHIFFPCVFAYGQVIIQTECARAVGAREFVVWARWGGGWTGAVVVTIVRGCPEGEEVLVFGASRGLRRIQGDNGAVVEADTFAEGCGCGFGSGRYAGEREDEGE